MLRLAISRTNVGKEIHSLIQKEVTADQLRLVLGYAKMKNEDQSSVLEGLSLSKWDKEH